MLTVRYCDTGHEHWRSLPACSLPCEVFSYIDLMKASGDIVLRRQPSFSILSGGFEAAPARPPIAARMCVGSKRLKRIKIRSVPPPVQRRSSFIFSCRFIEKDAEPASSIMAAESSLPPCSAQSAPLMRSVSCQRFNAQRPRIVSFRSGRAQLAAPGSLFSSLESRLAGYFTTRTV